jgi:hypothetical protein
LYLPNVSEDFINLFTGNPSTLANGRKLAGTGRFESLYISADGSLLFGGCKGSGAKPYQCSVDFTDPAQPIARCSCPSRQIPCKHAVGLLYAYLQHPDDFSVQEMPEDVAAKRAKLKDRAEKKPAGAIGSARTPAMTKAKARTAAKKCQAQLNGLELAGKILDNIVRAGMHAIDSDSFALYSGQVKELGNYYIPGVQAALNGLLLSAKSALAADAEGSAVFTPAIEQANYLYALLKKASTYLAGKAADYSAFPETPNTSLEDRLHSTIEEQLGYGWKLTELAENGLSLPKAELLQLSFDCFDDPGAKQFVEEGVWMLLKDGGIYTTDNYRPYRAVKYVNPDDSCFQVMNAEPLYIYPGAMNQRVRWERSTLRPVTPDDLTIAAAAGRTNFSAVIKEVKKQLINPLGNTAPIMPLRVQKFYASVSPGRFAVADANDVKISLRTERFGHILAMLAPEQLLGQTMICRFRYDAALDAIYANPLSVVNPTGVFRCYY